MNELAWLAFALAAVPLGLVAFNLMLFRVPPRAGRPLAAGEVSVLIPARNEAARILPAVESVLASAAEAPVELIVYDDDSSDATASLVEALAVKDSRVTLLRGGGETLQGWGKPLACMRLAEHARGRLLIFMDADVRLVGDALTRIVTALDRSDAALLSGVPEQETESLAERLIVPLIPFVLLGYLPLIGMRLTRRTAFGVACGQLMAVEREAYLACGGHRAVAHSVHDGMALARLFRRNGYRTDLADFTPLAQCRLYRNVKEVVSGFAKNAHEGLGSPFGIVPWTAILLGGQVAWIAALPWAIVAGHPAALPLLLAASCTLVARALIALRFERSVTRALLLHPFGVSALVAVQWYAALRRLAGKPVPWKGRVPYERGAGARSESAGQEVKIDRKERHAS